MKRRNSSLGMVITLLVFSVISFALIIISGIGLFTHEFIEFTNDENNAVTIEKEGNYYIMIDIDKEDYEITSDEISVFDRIRVVDSEVSGDQFVFNLETFTTVTTERFHVQPLDTPFEYKGYTVFGTMQFNEGDYSIISNILQGENQYLNMALTPTNYVADILWFSVSILLTISFSIPTYKHYVNYRNIPLSKYQKKHVKK